MAMIAMTTSSSIKVKPSALRLAAEPARPYEARHLTRLQQRVYQCETLSRAGGRSLSSYVANQSFAITLQNSCF